MQRRENFWSGFLVVIFLCILILALSLSGNLKFLSSFLEKGTSAVQTTTFKIFQKLPFSESKKIKELESERLELLAQVSSFEKLKRDNAALSDQFQTSYPPSQKLLKADIIGAPSFIPGVSAPDNFIINKGLKDNLKVGSAVVIKNNLVGVISDVSVNLSKVNLVNNSAFSLTAKTENGAEGIVRGGAGLTLSNVLLSENIKVSELVLTKGDVNQNGIGVPPDLVIGKIKSVEKNPSDLFQNAEIESFINFLNLSTVFVYMPL
jgi:rod shape-determining protein MreC